MYFKKIIITFVTGLILTFNILNSTHIADFNNSSNDYSIIVFSDDEIVETSK